MKQMKLWMLGILISSLGLFTACSSVDLPVEKPEQGAAFRAMLKSLDWGTDTTFVYGHKTPRGHTGGQTLCVPSGSARRPLGDGLRRSGSGVNCDLLATGHSGNGVNCNLLAT